MKYSQYQWYTISIDCKDNTNCSNKGKPVIDFDEENVLWFVHLDPEESDFWELVINPPIINPYAEVVAEIIPS